MPLSLGKLTVDVSLCGPVPRLQLPLPSSLNERGARPLRQKLCKVTSSELNSVRERSLLAACGSTQVDRSKTNPTPVLASDAQTQNSDISASDSLDPQIETINTNLSPTMQRLSDDRITFAPIQPVLEPPRWAVPAKGEARLEPVCEAIGCHSVVDLTLRSFFRVGRSPASDIHLLHETSSRRHALLFHHPDGSCYVVDCGSTHGTYVNGVRIRSIPLGGKVVPHRVRRGALVRFGGPGAPAFVLKSFSVGFSYKIENMESPSCVPTLSPSRPFSNSLVLQLNTRLNALGDSKNDFQKCTGGILKKRSFDESEAEPCNKRQRRCISPAITSELPPIRLVSPDLRDAPLLPNLSTRRVTFNEEPQRFYPAQVTPDELSSDEEVS